MGQILTPAIDAVRHLTPAPLKLVPQPEQADSFDPIRRSVSLFDALARVDAKKPATDAARITALEAELARVCRVFEQTESNLLVELQTALSETRNGYHDDGHADRVARVYGLRAEVQ